MPFGGLSIDAGFTSRVQYNAREGAFFRVDRLPDSNGNFVNKTHSITEELAHDGVLMDPDNIEVGYARLQDGVDVRTQHHRLGMPGAAPSTLHKECIKIGLWLPKSIAEGDQQRELMHTGVGVKRAIIALHGLWEQHPEAQDKSKVPHVTVSFEDKATRHGSFVAPVFGIAQFVDRPIDWPIPEVVAAAPAVAVSAPQLATASAFGTGAQVPGTEGDSDLPF